MATTKIFVIVNFLVLIVQITEINTQGERCVTPNNYYGICVLLTQCPAIVNYYGQSPNHPTVINFLLTAQRNCGTRSIQQNPLVCCLDSAYYNRPQPKPQPQPQPQPQPVYRPQPTVQPIYRPVPQPTAQPVYRPVPQPTSQPVYRPVPQPTGQPIYRPVPQATTTQPIYRPEPQPTVPPQTTPQPVFRPDPHTQTVPQTTPQPIQPKPEIPPTPTLNEKSCKDPNGVDGVCKSLKECPAILSVFLIKENKDPAYVEYIKRSNENCRKIEPFICCPLGAGTTNSTESNGAPKTKEANNQGRLLTPEEGCGYSKVKTTKIVGGKTAKAGAFPWMTLIGYTNNLGEESFKCGGSLITTRHVLTAAHCIRNTLSFVRLGEHDLSIETDGEIQNVKVIKSQSHENYNKRDGTNDIAILYLERDVNLSSRVSTICLPLAEPVRSQNFVDSQPFVAGWGRLAEGGKSSNTLQYLQLPVLENNECKEQYRKQGKLISDIQFSDVVLCAGQLAGGQDSCQGDSGGPLMQPIFEKGTGAFPYYQIGVVSYGIGCARTDTPGVYTRVQHYVDWIKEKVNQ